MQETENENYQAPSTETISAFCNFFSSVLFFFLSVFVFAIRMNKRFFSCLVQTFLSSVKVSIEMPQNVFKRKSESTFSMHPQQSHTTIPYQIGDSNFWYYALPLPLAFGFMCAHIIIPPLEFLGFVWLKLANLTCIAKSTQHVVLSAHLLA